MRPTRQNMLGSTGCYHCTAESAFGHAVFREPAARAAWCEVLMDLSRVSDLQVYAVALQAHRFHIVLRHRHRLPWDDTTLIERWQESGGSAAMAPERLRERLTSLSGIMQTLLQRFGRRWHRLFGGKGRLWAERYHACLLADHSALAATVAWIERLPGVLPDEDPPHHQLELASIPLIRVTPGLILPADDAPFGRPPAIGDDARDLYREWAAEQSDESVARYGRALMQGWAMGRPESLTESTALLGRRTGRGRSRSIRELGDDLGLCGVWG